MRSDVVTFSVPLPIPFAICLRYPVEVYVPIGCLKIVSGRVTLLAAPP